MTEHTQHEPAEEPAAAPSTEPAEEPAGGPPTEPDLAAEIAADIEQVGRAADWSSSDVAGMRRSIREIKERLHQADAVTGSMAELVSQLKQTADLLAHQRVQLERDKSVLIAREQDVARAEHARDQGFASERAALERALAQRRTEELAALEAEVAGYRVSRLAEVAEAEQAEQDRVRSQIERERTEWDATRDRQLEQLRQQQEELQRQKGAVAALQSELAGRRVELDENELDLERRKDRMLRQSQRRSENLDEEVEQLIAEERTSFHSQLQESRDEAERLRGTIRSQSSLLEAFEHLQRQLGGRDPGSVIAELNALSDEVSRQTEELATRPTKEVRARLKAMESELKASQNTVEELRGQLRRKESLAGQAAEFQLANGNLQAAMAAAEQRAKIYESAASEYRAELDRLRAAYERPAEIEARYREIELPRIAFQDVVRTTHSDITEVDWLKGISEASDGYGLHFHPRILKAFHTALKTAEWSPLTILAGVSGTGKSELPRLYSHFGGLYFEPLSVQPNWDSQESMLGFFNSIDNRFDAQPLLRLLAQSQKDFVAAHGDEAGYPGLKDAVCLLLLDEMNLAHPELYFAEFLSKLELRRGKKGAEVPTLPVKIGAGMKPYELPLGRNVLWAGTMNQDETTKSLSDKVLDRSIIIHFPRPSSLKRRQKLAPLDANNRGAMLPVRTWQKWLVKESPFTTDEVKPYKTFIEDMNKSLAVAGRAIGHRVWQSVEYYMANYPDVREAGSDSAKKAQAMHVAFEDQLVQKVMPKLRGIDTRGDSRTLCLDKIRGQLVAGIGGNGFNLAEDFDLATTLGYGQFIWQSANYLKVDASDESA